MKANERVVLVGTKAVLVPYQVIHVPKYHTWMQNEELRALTASEELSLEEEYEMQRKWRVDEDKLTFIILARHEQADELETNTPEINPTDPRLHSLPMIGDVNMFFNGTPDDVDDFTAELEIMIAEPDYRRGGYATEALQLILRYATENIFPSDGLHLAHTLPLRIPVPSLVVRVGDTNTPSIRLFEKLGFTIVKHVKVFEEVEMRVSLVSSL
ncbi:acyl-CoA N-acyltransferase [Mucidula mucida]|nr:acyl-CoA N-acyltransferase [Mucidula mucida]